MGIVKGYGLDGRVSISVNASIIFLFTASNQILSPLSLLSNGDFSEGKAVGEVKLTNQLHLVHMSRKVELYLHFPMASCHSA
jgi:hypothetical protein